MLNDQPGRSAKGNQEKIFVGLIRARRRSIADYLPLLLLFPPSPPPITPGRSQTSEFAFLMLMAYPRQITSLPDRLYCLSQKASGKELGSYLLSLLERSLANGGQRKGN